MSESFNYGQNKHDSGAAMSDVDDFLKHRSRDRASDLIVRWKDDGQVQLWLATRAPIFSVWRHPWFRIVESEKEGRKERIVIPSPWGCHDSEDTAKKQYKRRPDGTRIAAPECPFDKLAEALKAEVDAGRLSWVEPIIKFEGDDRSKAVIIRPGDFWGAFSAKDLSDDEIASLRRAGVNRKEAWKSALPAKCSYVFVAAVDDDLASGLKLFVEGEAVGRKMQKAIRDEMDRQGTKDAGNPFKNPYMFRWSFDDKRDFADKYDIKVIGKRLSDEILAVIQSEPPDTSDVTAAGDADELRASIEKHALYSMGPLLDRVFGASESRTQVPKDAPVEKSEAKATEPAAKKIEPLYECDHCNKVTLGEEDRKCSNCGAEYALVGVGAEARVVLSSRPCTACKTPISLPAKIGEKVPCPKCGEKHHEEEKKDGDNVSYEWFHDVEKKPEEMPAATPPARVKRGTR